MKAILIDPKEERVMQIDYNGDYKTIYEHLSFINSFGNSHKVRAFDVVRTQKEGTASMLMTRDCMPLQRTSIGTT